MDEIRAISQSGLVTKLLASSLCMYFGLVLAIVIPKASKLFVDPHGRWHRISGGIQLFWLVTGSLLCVIDHAKIDTTESRTFLWIFYNVVLSIFGIQSTLSAAKGFPHRKIRNNDGKSGTLHEKAIVTQAEMVEHIFYQILNLIQIIYLHVLSTAGIHWAWQSRLFALWMATSPWLVRQKFPVHSFRNNWKQSKSHSPLEVLLYQIKKWQYVFFKHAVLHSLNISMFLKPFALEIDFHLFWLCLNTSYVMEFFMQTLVKRKVMTQKQHLLLQQLLMTTSSASAISSVLRKINWGIFVCSLLLNFVRRHHDVLNTVGLAVFAKSIQKYHEIFLLN